MREEAELSISELRQKRGESHNQSSSNATGNGNSNGHANGAPHASHTQRPRNGVDPEEIWARPRATTIEEPERRPISHADRGDSDDDSLRLPFDPVRLFEVLKRRWYLWIGAGVLLFIAGVCYTVYATRSMVQLQLMRRDTPALFRGDDNGEAVKPQQFNEQTLIALVKNPQVLRNVSAKANPPITPANLSLNLTVVQERDTDLVTLTLKGKTKPQEAVNLLNLYATEFVRFTQEMQVREAESIASYVGQKLQKIEQELATVDTKIKELPPETKVTNLTTARDELAALLVKYTEAHPLVQDQQLKVKALEAQLAAAAKITTQGSDAERLQDLNKRINGLSENSLDYSITKSRFESLETLRSTLATRQREAQLLMENALGYFQVFTPATLDRVSTKGHLKKGLLLTVMGTLFGMVGIAGLVLLLEIIDDRVKTPADLKRVTELPLLASLGDLDKMSPSEQSAWAFRTWTILKGKLTRSQTQGMVCGFISAHHGEGRTTWINLLTKTANQRGLRVLTVATKPSEEPAVHPHETTDGTAEPSLTTMLSTTAFSFPAQVSQQLSDPNAHNVVHIPLPGWVWNMERREQWHTALDHWRKIENLVLLVELPPASEPESVLLAERVPQLVWLTDSGKTNVHETRTHIETLRHAGCNLVGAVLNREPSSFWQRHVVRRFGIGMLFFAMSFSSVQAAELAEEDIVVTNATRSFSVVSPSQRANWQKRLTLGPGDILTLGYYGETNLTKTDVVVRPDGRISYMQAHDILATGLTVDELRDKFNQELSKFYRSPRVLVSPVAYHSKKYYVLGRVTLKGSFTLDRPMTVVEAVARAEGLETGILDNRNSIDLADLQRSFLIRDGQRVPIDFEKLFGEGDLSQNIPIEPNDYLYFPPATLREVYVVGEVTFPGVVPFTSDTSVLSAIAQRNGFTRRAYRSHVLIVRGSLNNPITFVANTAAMVDGRLPDFKLEPKDIIYVSSRPFIRAEDLLDNAATSFLQSAVAAWSGLHVGPLITQPFIPKP